MSSFTRSAAVAALAALIAACHTTQSLTQQALAVQSAADEQVAVTRFDRDLDQAASYHVHKDGFVVIRFKDSAASEDYTAAVSELRSKPSISGMRAQQGGREVCILSHGRR